MNRRWPAAIAAFGIAWYASESLRHRRDLLVNGDEIFPACMDAVYEQLGCCVQVFE